MAAVIADCPHCGGKKVGFTFASERYVQKNGVASFLTWAHCNNCLEAITLKYRPNPHAGGRPQSPLQCPADPVVSGYNLVGAYPAPTTSRVPSHVPAPLDRFFSQAAENLKNGNYDASGAMSRKVIDVSTKRELGPEHRDRNAVLAKRIDAMAVANLITEQLKDWAHQIRLGGNDAAHDEDPYEQAEASELLDFVELYLTYVYSLPQRLEERKARAAEAKAETV